MAGLLNIVPRYLPRYGMAPDWARATRPLVLIFTSICFVVTILFKADVDAQAGAYATGVLAVITSATIAVTLSARRRKRAARARSASASSPLIFIYTTGRDADRQTRRACRSRCSSSSAIIVISLISRVCRSTELRAQRGQLRSDRGQRFIEAAAAAANPHHRQPSGRSHPARISAQGARGARSQQHPARRPGPLPGSHRARRLRIRAAIDGAWARRSAATGCCRRRAPRCRTRSPPCCSSIRDHTGSMPHVYFGWTEGNPLKFLARFILFGEGDIAPVTHEVLRRAEPDRGAAPRVSTWGEWARCHFTRGDAARGPENRAEI